MKVHPDLYAGYNTAPNNGDEVDGAGVNYPPVSPQWVSVMTPRTILIMTEEMLEVFDGCADYTARKQGDTVVIPREFEVLTIREKKAA